MNWGRVKTVFIILFLISDLFLLSILINSEWKQGITSSDVIDSTVQILSANGIAINPDIIPKKVSDVPYAEAENIITGYDIFAKRLLGEDAQKTADDTFEGQSGLILYDGNSFCFKSKAEPTGGNISEKDAEHIASDFLSNNGFRLKHTHKNIRKTSAGYTVTFENTVSGLPIFNNIVTVEIQGESVTTASGIWFNLIDNRGPESDLKSITSVLIDSITNLNLSGSNVTFDKLSLGYTIPESNTYHKSAVLVPVWEIRDTGANTYYIDARNPQ